MADPFIGDYRFSGPERTAYNRLTNRDEQWAYLVFARERHAAEDERKANNPRIKHKYRRDRFLVMREWRALDPEEHKNRIKAARTDLNRPDAIDVAVPPGVGSPGSINDFSDIGDSNEDNNDGQWTNGFNYRFARSLWHRGYRQENAPGGYWSAVRLYVGVDDSNKVRDIVVVKVVDYPDSDDGFYETLEFKTHLLVTGIPDNDHILKPRSRVKSFYWYRPRDPNGNVVHTPEGVVQRIARSGLRSYWDYCEGGDLVDLIEDYSWENLDEDVWKIPEKFIWHIFHSIALALYALHTLEPYNRAKPEDEERGFMVHRDIKPGNIFLKYEYDDKYPGYSDKYPRVVLGDFDLAETIDDIRGMKPLNYRIGTPGSMAPEYYDAAGPGLITTKADVWSLAGVLWDLMNSKRGLADDPDYLPDHNSGLDFLRRGELHDAIIHGHPNFQDPEYPTHHFIQKELHTRYDLPQYTTWLANLVADCSTHHPSMRMGVITLVKEIKKHMDNVRLTTGGLGGPHDDLRFKEDPFLQNRIISLTRRRGG